MEPQLKSETKFLIRHHLKAHNPTSRKIFEGQVNITLCEVQRFVYDHIDDFWPVNFFWFSQTPNSLFEIHLKTDSFKECVLVAFNSPQLYL